MALVLEKGADARVRGREGETPLHAACSQGAVENVRVLIAHGADLNAQNDQGQTPLHRLVMGNCEMEKLRLLVQAGAALDLPNHEGKTPPRLALGYGQRRAYDYFLAVNGGREPRARRADKPTPFAGAAVADVVKALVSEDAEQSEAALREMAARGAEGMPEVRRRIEGGVPPERFYQLFDLLGPEAESALPALVARLGDPDHVLAVMGMMKTVNPDSFAKLPEADRRKAASALEKVVRDSGDENDTGIYFGMLLELGEIAAPQVLSLLRDPVFGRRFEVVDGLVFARFYNEAIEAELFKILGETSDKSLQKAALASLGRHAGVSLKARAALTRVLMSPPVAKPKPAVKEEPPPGLAEHAFQPATHIPEELREQEKRRAEFDEWEDMALRAAINLSRVGPQVIDEWTPLMTPLGTPARGPIIHALWLMGEPAVPKLVKLLEHDDNAVVITASIALGKIGKPATPTLAATLNSDNEQAVDWSIRILGRMNFQGREALPALLEVAASEKRSATQRTTAAHAALMVDPNAARRSKQVLGAIPSIMQVLDRGDFRLQGVAAEALGRIGAPASQALPLLEKRTEPPPKGTDTQGYVSGYVLMAANQAIREIKADSAAESADSPAP